jgi:hypothetical protein
LTRDKTRQAGTRPGRQDQRRPDNTRQYKAKPTVVHCASLHNIEKSPDEEEIHKKHKHNFEVLMQNKAKDDQKEQVRIRVRNRVKD